MKPPTEIEAKVAALFYRLAQHDPEAALLAAATAPVARHYVPEDFRFSGDPKKAEWALKQARVLLEDDV
jgi:hypothetical protein